MNKHTLTLVVTLLLAGSFLLLANGIMEFLQPDLHAVREQNRIERADVLMKTTTTVMQVGVVTEGLVVVSAGVAVAVILLSVGVGAGSLASVAASKARRASLEARMIYPDAQGAFPAVYQPVTLKPIASKAKSTELEVKR